jgi:hypothetical protein
MKLGRCLIFGMLLAALPGGAWGQEQASQPGQSSGSEAGHSVPEPALSSIAGMQEGGGVETEDTSGELPRLPAIAGGKGMSTAFLSELEKSNYLRAGVNVGGTYDDNPLLLASGTASNTSESIFPNLRIDESSSRLRWTLAYAGGLTVNQKLTSQNQGSHSLNFDSEYRVSPHVSVRVAEIFSLTTGMFDAGTEAGAGNANLLTPLASERSSATTVEANYHFALNDLAGVSGSFYDLHFTNQASAPSGNPVADTLLDSQTATGSGFWMHRILRGDWAGATYRFERIAFAGGGETRVHSFLAMDTLRLSNRVTVTGFVGPEYTQNRIAGAEDAGQWSVGAGADVGWQDQRTSLAAGYSRTISDGGGLLGAVQQQTVHASFRRELAPGWAASITGAHGTNRELSGYSVNNAEAVNLTSAGITLERNVGRRVGLRVGYTHDFQQQFEVAPGPELDAHRNRCFVTLSYQWAKPLGL